MDNCPHTANGGACSFCYSALLTENSRLAKEVNRLQELAWKWGLERKPVSDKQCQHRWISPDDYLYTNPKWRCLDCGEIRDADEQRYADESQRPRSGSVGDSQ